MSEKQIAQIVEMRRQGHSFAEIGLLFGKDHTTILFHCRKAGIPRSNKNKRIPKIIHIEVGDKSERINLNEDSEIINLGKSYEDYLAEEKERNWKKRKDLAPPRVE